MRLTRYRLNGWMSFSITLWICWSIRNIVVKTNLRKFLLTTRLRFQGIWIFPRLVLSELGWPGMNNLWIFMKISKNLRKLLWIYEVSEIKFSTLEIKSICEFLLNLKDLNSQVFSQNSSYHLNDRKQNSNNKFSPQLMIFLRSIRTSVLSPNKM